MKGSLIDLLIIISTLTAITCLVNENLQTQEEEEYPLIVEYIDSFSINPDDLSNLLANQFYSISIGTVSTVDYEILNSKINSRYLGTSKNVQKISPFEIHVEKDSFELSIIFQVKILRAVSKTYNCSVKTSQIMMNYTKSLDYKSGGIVITNYHNIFQSHSFEPLNCSNIVKKDEQFLIDSVNSTKTSSIYLQLSKHMSKITDYFAYNSKKERISQTYQDNPYSYDYYGFQIDINVQTLKLQAYSEQGLQNSMAGTIEGTSHKTIVSPEYLSDYNTFYSIQFIQNFIQFAKDSYPAWQNIKLTRNNMRTSTFAFRLIDFEDIIPEILNRYPKFYLSDVSIQCSIADLQEAELDQKLLYQNIKWNCLGSFQPNATNITFLDFTIGLRHTVSIDAQSGAYLTVRVKKVQMISLTFEYIEDFKVIDPFIAAQYITSGLFQFEVITIGTFFKIRSQTKRVKLIPGIGIWIG